MTAVTALLLWLIYSLTWFLTSCLFSIVRGGWNGLRPRSALALGIVTTVLHEAVHFYLEIH